MTGKKKTGTVKKRRPRRHIRKSLIIFLAVFLTGLYLAVRVPRKQRETKLKALGYDSETIEVIMEKEMADELLENEYYSEYLAESIRNGTLRKEYISLYTVVTPERGLSAEDFLLCGRLMDEGYEADQLQNLFSQLEFREMVPLLVYDYQWNEQKYIDDCVKNRKNNNEDHFLLDGNYKIRYKLTWETEEPNSVEVFISRSYHLPDKYEPKDLVEVSTEYAIPGMHLRKECAEAAVEMMQAGQNDGTAFFLNDSYWDYETLEGVYESCIYKMPDGEADINCIKAGYSEKQSGLSVSFASTYETDKEFAKTTACKWLKENAYKYGFILRYPEGKEDITRMPASVERYRYVGKDLAEAVTKSHLTYDEYWSLYMKKWDNADNCPSSDILKEIENYTGPQPEPEETADTN